MVHCLQRHFFMQNEWKQEKSSFQLPQQKGLFYQKRLNANFISLNLKANIKSMDENGTKTKK